MKRETEMCGVAHDGLPPVACELQEGHEGDHEGYTVLTVAWKRDENTEAGQ